MGLGPEPDSPPFPCNLGRLLCTSVNDQSWEINRPGVEAVRVCGVDHRRLKQHFSPGCTGCLFPFYNCDTWVRDTLRDSQAY